MSVPVGAAALAAGAALALAGHVWHREERRHRLSGRRPRAGVDRLARRALGLGLAVLAAGALIVIAGH